MGAGAPPSPGQRERYLLLRFNLLLIGAGALPAPYTAENPEGNGVSIPFLSGRERSRSFCRPRTGEHCGFNPLLIGAGALPWKLGGRGISSILFQSPSYRGGSAPLTTSGLVYFEAFQFQSPSYRGGSAPADPAVVGDGSA